MKNKLKIVVAIFVVAFVSGCGLGNNKESGEEIETINPFSTKSMNNTYETSKSRINDTVQMENDNINKALEENGL